MQQIRRHMVPGRHVTRAPTQQPDDDLTDGEYQAVLQQVAHVFEANAVQASRYEGIPAPNRLRVTEVDEERARWTSLSEDGAVNVQDDRKALSDSQRNAYDSIMTAATAPSVSPRLFHISGKAGAGKTYLVNILLRHLRASKRIALATASTALASLLYDGGSTLHALAGLTIIKNFGDIVKSMLRPGGERDQLLCECDLLVIDEISSLSRGNLEAVMDLLRAVNSKAVVLTVGDFQQITPVVKSTSVSALVDASVLASHEWEHVKRLTLEGSQRHADPDFAAWLASVGDGTVAACDDSDLPTGAPAPPPNGKYVSLALVRNKVNASNETAMTHAFGDNVDQFENRAILCTLNNARKDWNGEGVPPSVADWNHAVQARRGLTPISLRGRTYAAVAEDEAAQALGDELEESGMLNDITESRVPNNVLNLAVGDIAFVLRTLDRDAHIVTNARVEILAINQQTVRVRVLSTGKEASIPKINFSFKLGRSSLQVVRVQFPLELAYAMTFNKGVHAQILPSGAFLDPAID